MKAGKLMRLVASVGKEEKPIGNLDRKPERK
jgi:hypothetical protein